MHLQTFFLFAFVYLFLSIKKSSSTELLLFSPLTFFFYFLSILYTLWPFRLISSCFLSLVNFLNLYFPLVNFQTVCNWTGFKRVQCSRVISLHHILNTALTPSQSYALNTLNTLLPLVPNIFLPYGLHTHARNTTFLPVAPSFFFQYPSIYIYDWLGSMVFDSALKHSEEVTIQFFSVLGI